MSTAIQRRPLSVQKIKSLLPKSRGEIQALVDFQSRIEKDIVKGIFYRIQAGRQLETLFLEHKKSQNGLPKSEKIPWVDVCQTLGYGKEQVRKFRLAYAAWGNLTSEEIKTLAHEKKFQSVEEALRSLSRAKKERREKTSRKKRDWKQEALRLAGGLRLERGRSRFYHELYQGALKEIDALKYQLSLRDSAVQALEIEKWEMSSKLEDPRFLLASYAAAQTKTRQKTIRAATVSKPLAKP